MTIDRRRAGATPASSAGREDDGPSIAPRQRIAQRRAELRAISADAALLRRLRGRPRHARVHSVFARAINIDVGGGRLLTLAQRDADDAPDSVVVDLDAWPRLSLERGTPAELSARRIDLGRVVRIALDDARPWRGRLPRYPQDERTLRANLPCAFDYLQRHGKGLGIGSPGRPAWSRVEETAAAAFRAVVDALVGALARGDEPGAFAQIDRLLGLGTGLTPSGDDLLVGLLAALNVGHGPFGAWRGIGGRVAERAGERTNVVSAAALRHAARGCVRASIADLCRALMREGPDDALAALDRVMRIGSGSGSEIAFGVLAGFFLQLGRCEARAASPAPDRASGVVHGG